MLSYPLYDFPLYYFLFLVINPVVIKFCSTIGQDSRLKTQDSRLQTFPPYFLLGISIFNLFTPHSICFNSPFVAKVYRTLAKPSSLFINPYLETLLQCQCRTLWPTAVLFGTVELNTHTHTHTHTYIHTHTHTHTHTHIHTHTRTHTGTHRHTHTLSHTHTTHTHACTHAHIRTHYTHTHTHTHTHTRTRTHTHTYT